MEPYFSDLVRKYDLLPRGCRILAAVSGGRDSVCLLHKLVTLAPLMDWTILAAHLDHGIRENSSRDADFVRALCRDLGVECRIGSADVPALRVQDKLSLEDAARRARYRFLDACADEWGADVIALAHHAGDQTETMLLHLLRGTGLTGACGMQPRRGRCVRPMLCVPTQEVQAYFEANGLCCVQDETNLDLTNPRNAIRHRVLEELEKIAPHTPSAFYRASENFREDEEALNHLAQQQLSDLRPEAGGVSAGFLLHAFAAINHRSIRHLAQLAGLTSDLTRERVEAVCRGIAAGSSLWDLHGGFSAQYYRGRLWIGRSCDVLSPVAAVSGAVLGTWHLEREILSSAPDDYRSPPEGEQCFSPLPANVFLTFPRPGDRVQLTSGSKSLSRYFSDCHVPPWLRTRLPVLVCGGEVIWIPYTGYANPAYFVRNPAQPVEYLRIRNEE